MAKKSIPNSIIFLMCLGIDVWAEFGGLLVPKWSQAVPKIHFRLDHLLMHSPNCPLSGCIRDKLSDIPLDAVESPSCVQKL